MGVFTADGHEPPATNRSSSATTSSPASARSSRSTRPRSGRHSAAPASTRTRPRTTRCTTCSSCPAAWRTRTRSPASTSAAARRSSGATRTRTRARRCCAPTAGSSQSLGGRYYTACDVGTYVQDMDVVAKETRFVTGRSESHGGAGDSLGPHRLRRLPGHAGRRRAPLGHARRLAGRRVGIAGLGKVGKHLTEHLLDDGASVVATDVSERALDWAAATYPQVDLVDDTTS